MIIVIILIKEDDSYLVYGSKLKSPIDMIL